MDIACRNGGLDVLDVARDGLGLIATCDLHGPDVVIATLDVLGAEIDQALGRLASRHRVLLYLRAEAVDHRALLGLGAAGLVSQYTPLERVAHAIRRADADELVLDDPFQTMAARAWVTPPRERLSPREVDVLRRASEDEKNREIARALNVSEATVKAHLRNAYDKLGARSRHAAVREAERRGELGAALGGWPSPGPAGRRLAAR